MWVPKPGSQIDETDRPRTLSPAEIEEIVSRLPDVRGAGAAPVAAVKRELIKWLTQQLSQEQICPSAMEELAQEIITAHNGSRIHPGTPVGMLAAASIGASATQTTLNTFRTAGAASSVASGVAALRRIIFVQNIKAEDKVTTIFFKDRTLTYEQVMSMRARLVGTYVSDFLLGFEVTPPSQLHRYWWSPEEKGEGVDSASASASTSVNYPSLMGKKIPASDFVMRLYLDVNKLYSHRVTLEKLAEVLEKDTGRVALSPGMTVSSSRYVTVVHGPMRNVREGPPGADGKPSFTYETILDIYPHRDTMSEALRNSGGSAFIQEALLELTFFSIVVEPALKAILVKGIPGVTELYPQVAPLALVIQEETPFRLEAAGEADLPQRVVQSAKNGDSLWRIIFNRSRVISTGIGPDEIASLCQKMGMEPLATVASEYMPKAELIVALPAGSGKKKPSELIAEQVAEEKMRRAEYIRAKRSAGVHGYVEAPAHLYEKEKASSYVFAEAQGGNLAEVLGMPYVDSSATRSNDLKEIAAVLGIEAAWAFYVKELGAIIENSGSYVNPAHIMICADNSAYKGTLHGLNFTGGISKQSDAHLTKASTERAVSMLSTAAMTGSSESMMNASAAVALGVKPRIGTGSVNVALNLDGHLLINDEIYNREESLVKERKAQAQPVSQEDLIAAYYQIRSEATVPQPPLTQPPAASSRAGPAQEAIDFDFFQAMDVQPPTPFTECCSIKIPQATRSALSGMQEGLEPNDYPLLEGDTVEFHLPPAFDGGASVLSAAEREIVETVSFPSISSLPNIKVSLPFVWE